MLMAHGRPGASPRRFAFAASACAALLCASTAFAHHSGAMYDAKTKVTLQGTIVEFQWANPHAWIQVEAVDPATKHQVKYVLESLGTNQLTRAGWKRDSLKPGDIATVVFNPLRDGGPGGRMVSVSVDGKPIGLQPGE